MNNPNILLQNIVCIDYLDDSTLDILLEQGVDVDKCRIGHSSLIEYSSSMNNYECVRVLLLHGADPNARAFDFVTPLMLLSGRCSDMSLIRLILESGACINEQDMDDDTALIWAVSHNNIDAVRLLLEYGADTTLKDENGDTALDIAIDREFLNIIELLE